MFRFRFDPTACSLRGESLAWNHIRLYSGSLLDQLRNECILICILRGWQEICLFKVMIDLSWNAGTHIHTDAGLCPLFLTILKLNTVPQAGTELVWATFFLFFLIRKTPLEVPQTFHTSAAWWLLFSVQEAEVCNDKLDLHLGLWSKIKEVYSKWMG